MWADSGAGALSMGGIFAEIFTFFLLVIISSLFLIQYLRKRKNKPMSKIISGFGIALSILIFLNHTSMTFAHLDFIKKQKQIVSDPNYVDSWGRPLSIREGWIKSGYRNIRISIIESVIFGLLPLLIFYRQYRRISLNRIEKMLAEKISKG